MAEDFAKSFYSLPDWAIAIIGFSIGFISIFVFLMAALRLNPMKIIADSQKKQKKVRSEHGEK